VKTKTLDILEDCLSTLYKARKSSLQVKALKYERQLQKRMLKNKQSLRPRTPNPKVDYDDYGDDDMEFVDSLAGR